MSEEITDGKIKDWPCSVAIMGNKVQGFDVQTAPYTVDDASPPHDVAMAIEACEGVGFKTLATARDFAERSGFTPDSKWGEMVE